ncbi:MAG: hypothetical protein N2596_07720 [Syntrophorhabdaceae bacterium]|nr:hypothetical protein [Syntrophorhabdaceae bacterium]
MYKAYVLGERHLIMGFKSVGFELIPVEESSKLKQELLKLSADPDAGLVFVTESLVQERLDIIEEFRQRSKAIISIIPTHEGSRHTSFSMISKLVERSIGIDILGKDINK